MSFATGTRRSVRFALRAAAGLSLLLAASASAQVPGQNVNMVSGTGWPEGDPFLQRQNEPSCAVSTANPRHVLCGANDYRTVDLPGLPDGEETGDAWLGVFKSLDGAQTWKSTLLPGYPQDQSFEGLASPTHGLAAAADPVVRPGPGGIFYYTGIAFNRGTNIGKIFVSRFVDVNDGEVAAALGADPVRYVDAFEIDSGTSGQFLDKPWSAVGLPTGASTCAIPVSPTETRTVPAAPVYFAWAKFTGAQSSKIMFTRSLDCGVTWSNPVKLSESSSVNQGTTVAVDPVTGYVYVAWRRFLAGNQTDAILLARSTDGGQTFPNKDVRQIATIAYPFDQGVTGTRFRTNALPTIAVSVNAAGTRSWAHVAWSQRSSATADSRIVMTTSADGVMWPAARVVDAAPVADDYGGSFTSGHQFMPQLSFAGGKLMLLYYDQRLDHTLGLLQPNQPFQPNAAGRFYREQRVPRGELLAGPGGVFTPFVDEAGLTQIRHTLDLRVAQADVTPLDSAPATDPGSALAFTSARVSEYVFGTRGDETDPETIPDGKGGTIPIVEAGEVKRLRQLQVNPPNLPIFRKGTLPFIGDYVDLVALQFVPDPAKPGGWAFNTAPSRSPVFYATWTSNQDVRPPAALNPDGSYDWSAYTPPFVPELGTQSLFDPAETRPECVTGNEGTRNQNVYVSAISQGLEVSSPQNVKALGKDLHAFVVTVRNATDKKKAFELRLADIPAGVGASFRNDPGYGPLDAANAVNPAALQRIQVEIPARSGISRSVFVRLAGSASAASSLRVDVAELASSYGLSCLQSTTCVLDPNGLTGTVRFNPPGSVAALTQPDIAETYDAEITPLVLNTTCAGSANVTSANVTSPNCLANVTSANVTSANVTSFHIANPDLANVTSANVTSANVTSANVTSANVTSQPIAANVTSANVTSANVTSSPISDATYTLTNTGNTTHSYHVKIVSNTTVTQPLQLVLSKTYTTPLGLGCALVEEPHALVQANVDNVTPAIQLLGGVNPDPNIPDPRTTNATVALAPGESAQITIRGTLDVTPMAELATHIAPVVIPHAGGGAFATVLLVASSPGSLGSLQVGVPYAGQLTAIGGSGTYAWSVVKGPLPPGLTLGDGGDLAGTPTQGGTWTFTVGVQDPVTQHTAEQTLTLGVAPGQATVLTTTSPSPSYAGQLLTFTVAVTPSSTATGLPVPTGTVTLQYGSQTATGSLSSAGTAQFQATFAASGAYPVTATYGGDGSYVGAAQTFTLSVRAVNATSTELASTPNPSVWGQPVTFTASVTSGGGTPAGSVAFAEGATVLATQSLVGGAASYTSATLSVATHTVTAIYASSSPAFAGSSSLAVNQVVNKADTTTTLTSSKNPSIWPQSVTFTATVAAKAPGAGAPTGTVTFYDGPSVLGTGTVSSGKATYTTTTLTAASHSLTAAYGGDTSFKGSTSAAVAQVVGTAYRFVGFQSPLATAGTLDAPTVSGSWTFSRVLPIKWQLFDVTTGASITRLDATKTLTALRAGNTCPSPATGSSVVLYTPTQGAAGGSTYRSSSSGYTFNWDATKNATAGCYWLKLELDDGTIKVTEVQLN